MLSLLLLLLLLQLLLAVVVIAIVKGIVSKTCILKKTNTLGSYVVHSLWHQLFVTLYEGGGCS